MTAAARLAGHPRSNPKAAHVPVRRLRAHPDNIRTDLGDLRELAASIRHEGVLVPLMAEDHGSHLVILHGHRRWAAAQLAGVARVPVIVVDIHDPPDAILLMLAEDKKTPVDPADRRRAVQALRERHGMTWPAIADRLGVSTATVRAWAGATPAPAVRNQNSGGRPGGRPTSDRPAMLRPTAVHRMLDDLDHGRLQPGDVITQLREWLGDWAPAR